MTSLSNWRNDHKFRDEWKPNGYAVTPRSQARGWDTVPAQMVTESQVAGEFSQDATRYLQRAGVEPRIYEMLGLEVPQ